MTKYEKLLARRQIPGRNIALNERYYPLQESEDVKYLLGSMEPMDAEHTKVSLGEAERVYKYLVPFCTIRIQGSVTTNTHIRYQSDVDVLTISDQFSVYEGQLPNNVSPFYGDSVQTLKDLRKRCRQTIAVEFPKVTLKDKDRAIELSGGSLQRKVDVVTANWYHTIASQTSNLDRDRGIHVLDVSTNSTVLNKPFLHAALINGKNAATKDGTCRAIRFLKTLKVDADQKIPISSYDICSLIWNMDNARLNGEDQYSFQLARYVEDTLWNWAQKPDYLRSLMVPNQTRRIIDGEGTTVEAVKALWLEAYQLLDRISKAGRDLQKRVMVYNNSLLQY